MNIHGFSINNNARLPPVNQPVNRRNEAVIQDQGNEPGFI